jgi:superoxide dismutase, Fe-Mn family
MAFTLPDLPYAHDALASLGMSKETLEYHHDLHHKAYVDNGNKLIAGTEWEGKSLEEIVAAPTRPARWRRTASSTTPASTGTTTCSGKWMGPGENKKMPGALERR